MVRIARATQRDLEGILAVLREHHTDPSIRSRSQRDLARHLRDFVVAHDDGGNLIGCVALERTGRVAELSSLAVFVESQGQGAGLALVAASIGVAQSSRIESVWLSTTKPAFFRRTGFEVVPFRRAPLVLHFKKLVLALRRPHGNWRSGLTGEMLLMKLALPAREPTSR